MEARLALVESREVATVLLFCLCCPLALLLPISLLYQDTGSAAFIPALQGSTASPSEQAQSTRVTDSYWRGICPSGS